MNIHNRLAAITAVCVLFCGTAGGYLNAQDNQKQGAKAGSGDAVGSDVPPPPPFMGKGDKKGEPRKDLPPFLAKLPKEEQETLKKMAIENPSAFRNEIHKRFKQMRAEEEKKMHALRGKYLDSKTELEKKLALKNIEDVVKTQYQERLEFTKKFIEEAEKNLKEASTRLETFKKDYEKRRDNSAELISTRVKEILDGQISRKQEKRDSKDDMPPPPPED